MIIYLFSYLFSLYLEGDNIASVDLSKLMLEFVNKIYSDNYQVIDLQYIFLL